MKTYKEFIEEALLPSLVKGAARYAMRNKHIRKTVSKTALQSGKKLRVPRQVTGFQTARGSKYTFSRKPDSWGKTQRTAVNDPTHPTKPGVKQKSDWTLFTTPSAASTMKARWMQGVSRKDFYKGLPLSPTPKKGRAAVEVWNKYQGKGRAIHNSNPITDLQTKGKSALSLYGAQRKELSQRVSKVLKTKQNRNVLKQEIEQGNDASLTNIYRNVRQNPSSPNTLENELRGRYRGKGVGRKETTTEQLAPLEKENQLPYKYSKYGIRTVEPSMDKLKDRVKRYGNIQRLKDIDPRYP